MTRMQAVGFTGFGGPEVLRLVSLPVPVPGPGEVRVRIAAAAVNPTDLAFRSGGHGSMPAVRPFSGETERGITVTLVLVFRHLHEGGTLAGLAELAAKGVLSLRVADVLPAVRAAEAHRRFEAHGVRGRLVLAF